MLSKVSSLPKNPGPHWSGNPYLHPLFLASQTPPISVSPFLSRCMIHSESEPRETSGVFRLWPGSLHQQGTLGVWASSSSQQHCNRPGICLLIKEHHLCPIKQVRKHQDGTLHPFGSLQALKGKECSIKGQALSLPPEPRAQVWHPMETVPGESLQDTHPSNPYFL